MSDFTPSAFLAPIGDPPAFDQDLAVQLQATVAGITGLDGSLVRPRWQAKPPAEPPVTVNWCAVGATDIVSDENANILHDPAGDGGDGTSTAYRAEEITVLASFYGPLASGYAARLRDGFAIQQNRVALHALGIALARLGTLRNASGLVNTENLICYDFDFRVRRRLGRTYAVPSIRSAIGDIAGDGGSVAGPRTLVTPIRAG